MAAFLLRVSQTPGKYLCFILTRISDMSTIDKEHFFVAITGLGDFLVERGAMEFHCRYTTQIELECKKALIQSTFDLSSDRKNCPSLQKIIMEYHIGTKQGDSNLELAHENELGFVEFKKM